ncbi:MAG: hypothetical protein QUS07_07160 [Methanothrix sp.]|nr:hypothetical protein [Methanothrix sp.]
MKQYIVTIQVGLEILAETAKQAGDEGLNVLKEAIKPDDPFRYRTIQLRRDPECIGGDDDLATDLCEELGAPYETIETWLKTQPDRDEVDIEVLVERYEHQNFF